MDDDLTCCISFMLFIVTVVMLYFFFSSYDTRLQYKCLENAQTIEIAKLCESRN